MIARTPKALSFAFATAIALAGTAARAAEPPSKQAVQEASVHFDRGVKLFEDGDYKLSVVEFRRSYQAVPDYRTLYNIGEVEFQLGNFAEARRTLQRYLEEGGARVPPSRRADVERDLEALRIRTAYLHVNVNVAGADIEIDGQRVATAPLHGALLVNGGSHTIVARKTGFVSATNDVALAGAEEKTVALALTPVPAEPVASASSGPAWIGWGVTGALVAGTVGMGVSWESASADLADTKSRPTTQAELDQKAHSVETRRAITVSLGAAALVAAGISTYLTLAPSRRAEPTRARVDVSPFGVSGRF